MVLPHAIHMRTSHRIVAVLLAIFVAGPLCCCFSHAAASEGPSAQPCCASLDDAGRETPEDTPCERCQSTSPRLADGGKTPLLSVDLPLLADLPAFAATLPRFEELAAAPTAPADPDPGPARLGLALRQTFLI